MSSMSTMPKSKCNAPADHAAFLGMLPYIHRYAQFTFRKAESELRDDLVQEVIVNCFVAYARLVELNKEGRAFPSALARFAVAQVRAGRRVGNRLRIRELLSPYAQRQKGFRIARLDHFDEQENCWREIVLEDKRATPAEIAACRLDFSAWLRLLPSAPTKDRTRAGHGRNDERRGEDVRRVAGEGLPVPAVAQGELECVPGRRRAAEAAESAGRLRNETTKPATEWAVAGRSTGDARNGICSRSC